MKQKTIKRHQTEKFVKQALKLNTQEFEILTWEDNHFSWIDKKYLSDLKDWSWSDIVDKSKYLGKIKDIVLVITDSTMTGIISIEKAWANGHLTISIVELDAFEKRIENKDLRLSIMNDLFLCLGGDDRYTNVTVGTISNESQ